jgi:next-to-BRCA1 protein 1
VPGLIGVAVITLLLTVTACGLNPFAQEPAATPVPPTPTPGASSTPTLGLIPTFTPTPAPTDTPTPTPAATVNAAVLDATFVSDVTIPDGHEVTPSQSFAKTWELVNDGEAAWPGNTEMRHVDGTLLGPVESVTVTPREPGETGEITVEMIAPDEPGPYTSYWQLCAGEACFGDKVWVKIQVVEGQ